MTDAQKFNKLFSEIKDIKENHLEHIKTDIGEVKDTQVKMKLVMQNIYDTLKEDQKKTEATLKKLLNK